MACLSRTQASIAQTSHMGFKCSSCQHVVRSLVTCTPTRTTTKKWGTIMVHSSHSSMMIQVNKVAFNIYVVCNLPCGFTNVQMHYGTYTKHDHGGKTCLQSYGVVVFHLSNEHSYGDTYWVCSRLGRIFKAINTLSHYFVCGG